MCVQAVYNARTRVCQRELETQLHVRQVRLLLSLSLAELATFRVQNMPLITSEMLTFHSTVRLQSFKVILPV